MNIGKNFEKYSTGIKGLTLLTLEQKNKNLKEENDQLTDDNTNLQDEIDDLQEERDNQSSNAE